MSTENQVAYFEKVYRETFRRLSQYVFFKAPGLPEAEDIVATVYSDFYQYIVLKDKRPLAVMAYLTRMANHELSKFYRNRERLSALSLDDEDLGLSHTLPDDEDTLVQVFERFESEELWRAIQRLSVAEQQVIIAKVRFDLSFKQIAKQLDQGESAVKLRYYRALKKLAASLSD